MRKIVFLIALLLLVPIICQAEAKNLLTNSNFEQADPVNANLPLGWTPHGSCEWAKKGRNDTYCVIAKQSPWSLWRHRVRLQSGRKYVVSAWIKADKPGVRAQIGFSDSQAAGRKIAYLPFKLSTSWKYYSAEIEFTKIPSVTSMVLLNENQKADLYFDDVTVVDLTAEATAQQPSVQATAPVGKQAVTGKNLLSNSTFEQADPVNANLPLGWTTKGVVEWSKQGGRNGSACVIAKQSPWSHWRQRVSLKVGHKYAVSCWMKANKPGVRAQVGFTDTKMAKGSSWVGFKLTTEWKYYSFECEPVQTPASTGFVLLNEGKPGDIYFDDVTVVDLTASKSTQQPAIQAPSSVQVRAPTSGENLLNNANFEQPDPVNPGQPLGWNPTKKEFCEWIKKGKDGTYCVVVKNAPWTMSRQTVPLQAGHKYRLSAWIRADKPNVKALLGFGDLKWFHFQVSTEWKLYQAEIQPAKLPYWCYMGLACDNPGSDLYFDDVSLIDLSAPRGLSDIAVNLIPQGNAEIDSNGDSVPDGWHKGDPKYMPKTLTGDIMLDPSQQGTAYKWENKGHKSDRSLSMVVEPEKWGEWELEIPNTKPHTKYNLAFWYWQAGEDTGGYWSWPRMEVTVFGKTFSPNHFRAVEQWLYTTYNVNSGEYSGDVSIGFSLQYPQQTTKVLIDDVQLYEGEAEIVRSEWKNMQLPFFLGQNQARLTYFTYDESYISPDMVAPLPFGLDYQFLTKRAPVYLQINLDLPAEVEVVDYDARHWSSIKDASTMKKEQIIHDDRLYTRYTIYYPVNRKSFTHPSHPGFKPIVYYLKTALTKGSVDAYYSLKWDGGEQPKRKLPLEVIHIPKLNPSKFCILEDVSPEIVRYWPNALENFKVLGIKILMYKNPKTILTADPKVLQDIKNMKDAGFEVGTWMNVFDTYISDQSSWALDINGQPVKPNAYLGCYSRHGPAYKQMISNAQKCIDVGVTGFFADDEGNLDCYCDDCIKAFQGYLAKNASDVTFINPKVFMKVPKEYPKLQVLWWDFGRLKYANIVYDLRKELTTYLQSKGMDPKKLVLYNFGIPIISRHIDLIREQEKMPRPTNLYVLYGQAFDYYGDQLYINYADRTYRGLPNLAGDRQAFYTKEMVPHGLKQMPVPGADLTYCDGFNDFQPHAVMKWQLLELASAGVSGYYIYPFSYWDVDLLDMKYMNEALSIIQEVEDIVMNGLPEDWAKVDKGNVRTLKSDDERLVCVSEYSTFENVPVTIKVECSVNKTLNVVDVETGKLIAKLSRRKNTFEVQLGPERCKVFYVGKKSRL